MKIPPVPTGTGPAGRHLWRAVLTDYELVEHEVTLLRQAVRTVDLCDDLQRVVDAEGVMATNRLGDAKTHPAISELRQQRLALARLVVALRVPLGDQEQTPTAAPRRPLPGCSAGGCVAFMAARREAAGATWITVAATAGDVRPVRLAAGTRRAGADVRVLIVSASVGTAGTGREQRR